MTKIEPLAAAIAMYFDASDDEEFLQNCSKDIRQARREAYEKAAKSCDRFICPVSKSEWVNGQSTAAQQIRASIRDLAEAEDHE